MEFNVSDTHRFARHGSFATKATSAGLGWSKTYLSTQTEAPFSDKFSPISDILISVINSGSGRAEISLNKDLHKMDATRGSITIIPDKMGFSALSSSCLETTHLYLRRGLVNEVASDLIKGDVAHVEILPCFGGFDPVLEQLVYAVRDAMLEQSRYSGLYVDYLSSAIAARLVKNHSTSNGFAVRDASRDRLSQRIIEKTRSLIEDRLTERLTSEELVEGTGMSVDHFSRLFKQATGITLHQYVIRCRVDRARKLLANSTMPIVQVAFECGFSDQVHLTRVFSKVVGVTPGIFRREKKR